MFANFLAESSLHIGRVLDVEEDKESYIIGTVFCESIDRPNVFEEVERDQVETTITLKFYLLL